jgi:hypothetical protein
VEWLTSQRDISWHWGKIFIGTEKVFDFWLCWEQLRILILTLTQIKIISTKLEAYEWCTIQQIKLIGLCKYVNTQYRFMSGCQQRKIFDVIIIDLCTYLSEVFACYVKWNRSEVSDMFRAMCRIYKILPGSSSEPKARHGSVNQRRDYELVTWLAFSDHSLNHPI